MGVALATLTTLVLVCALEEEREAAFRNEVELVDVGIALANEAAQSGVLLFLRTIGAVAEVQGRPLDDVQTSRVGQLSSETFPLLNLFAEFGDAETFDLGFGVTAGAPKVFGSGYAGELRNLTKQMLLDGFTASNAQQQQGMQETIAAAFRGKLRPTLSLPNDVLMPSGDLAPTTWSFIFFPPLNFVGFAVLNLEAFLRTVLGVTAPGITVHLYFSERVDFGLAETEQSEYVFASALEVTPSGVAVIPDFPGGYREAQRISGTRKCFGNVTTKLLGPEDIDTGEGRLEKAYRHLKYVIIATDAFEPVSIVMPVVIGLLCVVPFVVLAAVGVGSLERQRILAQAELDKAVAVPKARAAAERSMNEFIAHEVRNPLSVATSANMFVRGHFGNPQIARRRPLPQVVEDLRLVDASLRFIDELLVNVIDLAHFEKGSIGLNRSVMSLKRDVLNPVHEMLQHARQGFDIQVVVDPADDDLWVEGDALRLKQVVMNLAKNSTKFVLRGFVRLTAGRISPGRVRIAVEDSGPGIPAAKRKHLFAKFQETLDKLNQGTGIGLALCKGVVTAMHGSIQLDESYNSGVPGCPGTRVVIVLPLKEARPTVEAPVLGSMPSKGRPEKLLVGSVLIVEDNKAVALLMERLVRSVCHPGVKFNVISNARDAIAHLALGHSYDLVFIDHYMPCAGSGLLGVSVIKHVRTQLADTSVVLVGCSANDVGAEHLASGANAFMRKPVKAAMLHGLRPLLPIPGKHNVMIVGKPGTESDIFAALVRILGHPKRVFRIDPGGASYLRTSLKPTIVVSTTSLSFVRCEQGPQGATRFLAVGVDMDQGPSPSVAFDLIIPRFDLALVAQGDENKLIACRDAIVTAIFDAHIN
ncbi:Sensory/regulatory protein RpfC [Durusdinium trenchii]|uniref:histidine kinase n=1 Tax=Durusdinium trenchii TaxID=1381693 RepID=A0ABP0JXV2_9DINO